MKLRAVVNIEIASNTVINIKLYEGFIRYF